MTEETRERITELARDYAAARVGTGAFLVNALLEEKERLERALRRIAHYPFAVTSNDQNDLRAVKEIAQAALASPEDA